MEFSSDRTRQDYAKFMEEESKEQQALVKKLEQPIELAKLKRELAVNAGKVITEKKKGLLGYQEIAYTPKDLQNVTMTWEEAVEFTSREAQIFANETDEWWDSPENKKTLVSYFDNRDISIIDRRMWRAAFLSLLRDGLLEPKPAPAPAVAPVAPVQQQEDVDPPRVPDLPRPIAHFEPEQGAMGWDENNNEVWYSAASISRMSSSQYKSAFHVRPPLLAA